MKSKNRNPSLPAIMSVFLWYMPHISAEQPAYVPRDVRVMECDASTAAVLPCERKWSSSHNSSKFFQYSKEFNATTVSRASIQCTEDPRLPELHPCIFQRHSNYQFPISPGMKFIRLHFHPTSIYDGLKISKALFSVGISGHYTLLNTSLESTSWIGVSDIEYVVKEYCINVDDTVLDITFSPARNFPGAYGFVNKIEVISIPQNLYIRGGVPLPIIGDHSKYFIQNSRALETMYRLNVGGDSIPPEADTGFFRTWVEDIPYLISNELSSSTVCSNGDLTYSSSVLVYTAPLEVYTTARTTNNYPDSNITWLFPLDSGFFYFVRLHFCESKGGVKHADQRVFQIYINNQVAEDHADVFQWSNGAGVPVYKDYIVDFSRYRHDIQNLSVEIGQEDKASALLNGLEIFKLSDDRDNLAGLCPFRNRNLQHKKSSEKGKKIHQIPFVLAIGLYALLILSCIWLFIKKSCPIPSVSLLHPEPNSQGRVLMQFGSLGHCRNFSLADMKSATNNFSDDNLLGAGGFGKVYKGCIDGGATFVAIKRGNPTSHQGLHEFQTEITMLSRLRHRHLVSLIGCCKDDKEMILVYDFMAQGTLRNHLYNTQKPPLPWKKRLKICIDAARGLHYLHVGTKHTIIHRDVKTTNILLDKGWVAKVADFGLSKVGPNISHTRVSTAVKGSFGYLDTEYYRRRKLTEKSDVYSFGVVLMEVLCARPAVLPMVAVVEEEEPEEELKQVNLAEWALHCHHMGTLDQIIDPYLRGNIDPECFKTFTDIAKKCLAESGSERPRMGDVLWNLELAWQQQEAADAEEEVRMCGETNTAFAGEVVVTIDNRRATGIGYSDLTPGAEFSDLIAPIGR